MSSVALALRERLAAWHYRSTPEGAGRRDLRIDLLRGFCLFVMTVDHIGGETSWLYAVTGADRLLVSAAEGFVLLSGLAMGIVHVRTVRRGGLALVFAKVLGRTAFLYGAAVGLTLAFAFVSVLVGAPYVRLATPAPSAADFALSVVTFHRTYPLTDILVLYTLLVLAAGPALALMSRGLTPLVLAASWLLWAVAQVGLERVPRAWNITDGGFPFAAWQLLFFTGLVVGFHREWLAQHLRPSRLLAIALAAAVAIVVFGAVLTAAPTPLVSDELLYDKNEARIGRVLAVVGATAFAFALLTVAWGPIRRATGWLLLTLGQRALFSYAVHLFVVALFASELLAPVRLGRENAIFQAGGVALVWLACLVQAGLADARRAGATRDARALRTALARAAAPAAIAVAALVAASAAIPALSPAVGAIVDSSVARPSVSTNAGPLGPGRTEDGSFRSTVLRRTLAYTVYLPPGYDAEPARRYPTVYLLHGGSGLRSEWVDYGVLAAADRLMGSRAIAPFIVVLPQGDQEYWVDHVLDASVGANGEQWGTYTAKEVVPEIDRRYRTLARADARALGGLSMGGHAAMQLPLNFPGIWRVIGVHSPSLRPYGEAATYLGRDAEFAARDPLSLIKAKADLARGHTWWLDAGDVDPWRRQVEEIHAQLTSLGIAHEWQPYPGDHSLAYWSAHVEDYLRYYAAALCRRSGAC